MRSTDHGRGHGVRRGEGLVCLKADFSDKTEAGDDAEKAH
jgi:hypothetical protein